MYGIFFMCLTLLGVVGQLLVDSMRLDGIFKLDLTILNHCSSYLQDISYKIMIFLSPHLD